MPTMKGRRKMDTISNRVSRFGFMHVFRMTESFGRGDTAKVDKGLPGRWDQNNGVIVVYDEDGQPWIYPASRMTDDIRSFVRSLHPGEYVPFSNDGGKSVNAFFLLGLDGK